MTKTSPSPPGEYELNRHVYFETSLPLQIRQTANCALFTLRTERNQLQLAALRPTQRRLYEIEGLRKLIGQIPTSEGGRNGELVGQNLHIDWNIYNCIWIIQPGPFADC